MDNLNINLLDLKKRYEKGETLQEIADSICVSRQTVSKWLKSIGTAIYKKNKMINLNQNIFDEINTEEKAYWLGFLFADGNLSSKGYYIRLNLSSNDKSHMEKLRKFLNYECEIKDYKNKGNGISRISVSNKHLWETLKSKGCVPNKSLILKFPLKVFENHKNLIRHFIRGYWDGDGCLTYRDKEKKRPEVNVISTNEFLMEMQKYLPVKQKENIPIKHKGNDVIRTWTCEGKSALNVAEYLYKETNVYLDRKYEKYLEFVELYKTKKGTIN